MSRTLLRIENRNTTSDLVPVEMMLMVGASSNRGLTGQGFGTKFVGIKAADDKIIFGRASEDEKGSYLAWYEIEPYMSGSVQRDRAVLVVQRDSGSERIPMTVDVNMVQSGWSRHLLGDDYPSIREPILDAADEDAEFKINTCTEMTYAPKGHTWTYIEQTPGLADVMEVPGYYFCRGDRITWISSGVGVAPVSSMNEAQVFVTAGNPPTVAYACWSTGRDEEHEAVPDPAFDYVLLETDTQKWVSMPKRLLEDSHAALIAIRDALCTTTNVDVLVKVLSNVVEGGWEASALSWPTQGYYWNRTTLIEALKRVAKGRPIHYTDSDLLFDSAEGQGHNPIALPQWMYTVGKDIANLTTVHAVLGIRESGEIGLRNLTSEERASLLLAMQWLETNLPWELWRSGHTFFAIDADEESWVEGLHTTVAGGKDVIAINFKCGAAETVRGLATIIVHQRVHHLMNQDTLKSDYHGDVFANTTANVLLPPMK